MSTVRVWVTGAGGLIGSAVARVAAADRSARDRVAVVPLTRRDLDLENTVALRKRFEEDRPSVIVHCAGLTRSPDCEADPERARRLNVDVTAQLASLPEVTLVFLSTDLVFDGTRGAYTESDPARPLSAYGRSKLGGEQETLRFPRHLVVRTSLNYGHSPTGNRSFNEEMVAAARAGRTLSLFRDEFRCPIPAAVTARALWELVLRITGPGPTPAGLLHLAGTERLSRWEIGCLLAGVFPELRGRIQPSSIREYTGAPRPPDTSLDCSKIQSWLSFPLPRFSEWLRENAPSGGACPSGS